MDKNEDLYLEEPLVLSFEDRVFRGKSLSTLETSFLVVPKLISEVLVISLFFFRKSSTS